ncbi:hypothetical protein [Endothiovibrio diazotrophicus]
MDMPSEEEWPDADDPGEPSMAPLRELFRLLPNSLERGGKVDFRNLSDDELRRLRESAEQLLDASIDGIAAIGGLLDWSMALENRPCEIYGWRLGLLLKMVAELMTICREVESAT